MGAIIEDVVTGTMTPGVANAAVSAGGKMLKAVELNHRYGRPSNRGIKNLNLLEGDKSIG